MKSFFITVVVALIFFLALIFGAQNEQLVTVSYFIAKGEYRLPIVLAVVFLAGFILSWLFASYHILKLKFALRQAEKKLNHDNKSPSQDIDA
ncbi:MAG: LapA family protein [Parashewanella sp.]